MALPPLLAAMSLPVIGAPLFIVSNPDLVIAQCVNGVVGAFPALNARPETALDTWITRIEAALADARAAGREVAPFAVNQIIHPSNERLAHDLDVCARHRVPLVITSLSAPDRVVPQVHAWGGLVFHDVISVKHAKRALDAGVDGLILVCAGAGGHAGTLSPFALVEEVRAFWSGPIALSGAIATGHAVLAAQAMGADLAYVGTRFIATTEANADARYKAMIVQADAAGVVLTPYFTGVPGNYLRSSIAAQGFDPDALPVRGKEAMDFASQGAEVKAWRDIWGAGQSVAAIHDIEPTEQVITRMRADYMAAQARLARPPL